MDNKNKPAFPIKVEYGQRQENGTWAKNIKNNFGLSKREHFALHLMQGLISNADRHSQEGDCQTWNYEHLSEISIKAADALLTKLSIEDGQ